MAEISLQGVSKVYPGGVKAVTDFTLDISDREFVILVGPSGCGKSTVLRMIAGLEEISSGKIYINGKLINDVPAKDRDIAMVFQSYALYPHKTVYENMAYGLRLRKTSKQEIESRIHEVAEVLEIEHLLERKPKALSGGERQRVALGRAMVRHPAVFLFDEPLSNLDAKLRASMRTELKKLHERLGGTFVYVTHDQTEAMTMGNKMVVMDKGIIRQADTPENIYKHPENVFTAKFIGIPQINMLDGTLEKQDGRYAVNFDNERIVLETDISYDEYVDRNIIAGVRPDGIRIADKHSNPQSVISAKVELIEGLGSESYLYLSYNGKQIIARTSSNIDLALGSIVNIELNTRKVYLFDKATGNALI